MNDDLIPLTIIYESEHGKAWRSPQGYGTFNAGHMLCVAMAKEIERLREGFRVIACGKMQEDAAHPMGVWFSMASRFIKIAQEQLTTPGNGKEQP